MYTNKTEEKPFLAYFKKYLISLPDVHKWKKVNLITFNKFNFVLSNRLLSSAMRLGGYWSCNSFS